MQPDNVIYQEKLTAPASYKARLTVFFVLGLLALIWGTTHLNSDPSDPVIAAIGFTLLGYVGLMAITAGTAGRGISITRDKQLIMGRGHRSLDVNAAYKVLPDRKTINQYRPRRNNRISRGVMLGHTFFWCPKYVNQAILIGTTEILAVPSFKKQFNTSMFVLGTRHPDELGRALESIGIKRVADDSPTAN